MDIPYYREYDLPWTAGSEQERRFRKLLAWIMAVLLFLGAVWPFIPTPAPDPTQVEEVPPRIAKLLLERKPPPPPPPQVREPEPEPVPEAEPEPQQVVEQAPEPAPVPEPDPAPVDQQQVRAGTGGIDAVCPGSRAAS